MAPPKKRRLTAQDMQPKDDDPDPVKVLLQTPQFAPMQFLEVLSKDQQKAYLASLENGKRTVDSYVEVTMSHIQNYVQLKVEVFPSRRDV